jgi:hypothetical protein
MYHRLVSVIFFLTMRGYFYDSQTLRIRNYISNFNQNSGPSNLGPWYYYRQFWAKTYASRFLEGAIIMPNFKQIQCIKRGCPVICKACWANIWKLNFTTPVIWERLVCTYLFDKLVQYYYRLGLPTICAVWTNTITILRA